MSKEQVPAKPTSRRYSPKVKAAAVRMVRALRAELGTEHATVHRVGASWGMASNRCVPGCVRPTSTTGIPRECRPANPSVSRILSRRIEN